MTLLEKIKKDRIESFKKRNEDFKHKVAHSVLGVLIGDATKESKEPTDERVIQFIKKFVENAKVVIENASPTDHLSKMTAEKEIEILSEYLPRQMDEIEMIKVIEENFASEKNMGMIMKHFQANFNGMYDGKVLSTLAKAHCSK